MVLEVTTIDVKPDRIAEFESLFQEVMASVERARGCLGATLLRCHEKPARYQVHIQWDAVEDHTVSYMNSADVMVYRKLIVPLLNGKPEGAHYFRVTERRRNAEA